MRLLHSIEDFLETFSWKIAQAFWLSCSPKKLGFDFFRFKAFLNENLKNNISTSIVQIVKHFLQCVKFNIYCVLLNKSLSSNLIMAGDSMAALP